jgi:carbamoyl-phosphate synthase small subunit
VREVEEIPSHYRSQLSLPEYLRQQRVPGLSGIDTRALTQRLRNHGTLRAALSGDHVAHDRLLAALSQPLARDHVAQVSTTLRQQHPNAGPHVALIDYGCKRGIVRALLDRGCAVTVFPHDVAASEILASQPDGIVLSNGPGDPSALAADVDAVLPTIRALQEHAPLLGICLGHQLFALANGAATEKLHHGHRGCNRSVFDSETGQSAIAAHNHGYAVTESSLVGSELRVTFRDLNDGCIEGLRHTRLPAWSVQFHPEAGPGPQDPRFLFDEFVRALAGRRAAMEQPCR